MKTSQGLLWPASLLGVILLARILVLYYKPSLGLVEFGASVTLLLITGGILLFKFKSLKLAQKVAYAALIISFSVSTTAFAVKAFYADLTISFFHLAALFIPPILLYMVFDWKDKRQVRKSGSQSGC